MTLRQTILKWCYPLLMKAGRKSAEKHIIFSPGKEHPLASFFDIPVLDLSGNLVSLQRFKGKKLLVVNTASDCGYTSQLVELEELFKEFYDCLNVVAIPSNDFKNQEKLEGKSISQFCSRNFGVSFPIFEKSTVVSSPEQSALYQWLSQSAKNGWNNAAPSWNFWKYLINEDGELLACFPSAISPKNEKLLAMIRKS